jgi:uncharacterized protein
MNTDRHQRIQQRLRSTLCMIAALTSGAAFAASFDCNRARLPDEKAVYASRQLSELDVEMSVRYQMMTGLVAMGTRGDMQDEQQTWLTSRHACGESKSCLLALYHQRIAKLKDQYAHLASRGPF